MKRSGSGSAIRLLSSIRAPLLVAALLRLGLMFVSFARTGTSIMTQGDTTSYLIPGRSLILHGTFATTGLAEIDRTPGYPIFAELTGMLFDNALLTASAQILVSLLSLLLIERIADRIFPNTNAGNYAAWFYAIEPLSIVYTSRIMPETLFVLLLLLVLDRVLAFLASHRLSALVAAGVALAAATFVRPVSLYLVFPLALGLAIVIRRIPALWWKAPATLLLATLPWLAAWQWRNTAEAGYNGFSSIVEKNLYFFQSAEVAAELQHTSLESIQRKLGYPDDADYLATHPDQTAWTRPQRLSYMHLQATKILREHPGLYLRTHFVGVAVVAFTPSATELLQLVDAYPAPGAMPHRILNEGIAASVSRVFADHPMVAIVMLILEIFLVTLYMLSAYACISAPRSPAILLILGLVFYFLLISGGAQAVGRYRIPVMPELCILAAGGLTMPRKKTTAESLQLRS